MESMVLRTLQLSHNSMRFISYLKRTTHTTMNLTNHLHLYKTYRRATVKVKKHLTIDYKETVLMSLINCCRKMSKVSREVSIRCWERMIIRIDWRSMNDCDSVCFVTKSINEYINIIRRPTELLLLCVTIHRFRCLWSFLRGSLLQVVVARLDVCCTRMLSGLLMSWYPVSASKWSLS